VEWIGGFAIRGPASFSAALQREESGKTTDIRGR
jgi:hypothetical protein